MSVLKVLMTVISNVPTVRDHMNVTVTLAMNCSTQLTVQTPMSVLTIMEAVSTSVIIL